MPLHCRHNAHMFYVIVADAGVRTRLLTVLKAGGINAVFHYVPLHSAPAGRRLGRASGSLDVTDDVSARLVRLPLWAGMTDADADSVVSAIRTALAKGHS